MKMRSATSTKKEEEARKEGRAYGVTKDSGAAVRGTRLSMSAASASPLGGRCPSGSIRTATWSRSDGAASATDRHPKRLPAVDGIGAGVAELQPWAISERDGQ
jgi:hypothetical protein